jgi:hypothetical protein
MPSYAPGRLRTLRVEAERRAALVLAAATAALRGAQAIDERLAAGAAAAVETLASARASAGRSTPARAVEAHMTRRYWARLGEAVTIAACMRAAHRAGPLAAAARADADARAAYTRARQQREAIDKAVARRAASVRRDKDRRAQAATDDRISRR